MLLDVSKILGFARCLHYRGICMGSMSLHLWIWWLNIMVLMSWQTFIRVFQDIQILSFAYNYKSKLQHSWICPAEKSFFQRLSTWGCVNTCHLLNKELNVIISCLPNHLTINNTAITACCNLIIKPAVTTLQQIQSDIQMFLDTCKSEIFCSRSNSEPTASQITIS